MKRWTKKELREIIKPYKEHFGVEVWNGEVDYSNYEVYMWFYNDKYEKRGMFVEENQSIYPNGSVEHRLNKLEKEEIILELEKWKEKI